MLHNINLISAKVKLVLKTDWMGKCTDTTSGNGPHKVCRYRFSAIS